MSEGRYSVVRFRLKSKPIRSGRFRPTNKPEPYETQQTARRTRGQRANRIEPGQNGPGSNDARR